MFIRDLFRRRSPVVSFEIFPPKREYPLETVYTTVEALRDLGPDFISVTYGAGGSSRERTVDIAAAVKERWGLTPLAHLTCLEQTEAEVDAVLDTLRERGIHNILALRGDPPQSSLGGPPPVERISILPRIWCATSPHAIPGRFPSGPPRILKGTPPATPLRKISDTSKKRSKRVSIFS